MDNASLVELDELARIVDAGRGHLEVRQLCVVGSGARRWPMTAVGLGNPARAVPAVGFFGGVHGIERIGTRVVLAFLGSLVSRLPWDRTLHGLLERLRLVFVPLVNPAGMWHGTRSNANGVDLMRNSPIESRERVPLLVGGQRLSARLPWFRGGATMESESQALCTLVREDLLGRPFSLALDCHSGFGLRDRIWFPYAHSREPLDDLPEVHALMELFCRNYPHHDYVFEPQCRNYMAHGDLWDHLYLQRPASGVFLPLTLEMGSWRWVRKSPSQIFSLMGIFNPLPPHRHQRVLRRHLTWFDFLCRAADAHASWLPSDAQRERQRQMALVKWYGGPAQ